MKNVDKFLKHTSTTKEDILEAARQACLSDDLEVLTKLMNSGKFISYNEKDLLIKTSMEYDNFKTASFLLDISYNHDIFMRILSHYCKSEEMAIIIFDRFWDYLNMAEVMYFVGYCIDNDYSRLFNIILVKPGYNFDAVTCRDILDSAVEHNRIQYVDYMIRRLERKEMEYNKVWLISLCVTYKRNSILDHVLDHYRTNNYEIDLADHDYNRLLGDLAYDNKFDIFKKLYQSIGFDEKRGILHMSAYSITSEIRVKEWVAKIKTEQRDNIIENVLK